MAGNALRPAVRAAQSQRRHKNAAMGLRELARFPALDGKTWNHPVLAGDIPLVRNGQEMAVSRLSLPGL